MMAELHPQLIGNNEERKVTKRGRDIDISPENSRVVKRHVSWLQSLTSLVQSTSSFIPLPTAVKKKVITDYFGFLRYDSTKASEETPMESGLKCHGCRSTNATQTGLRPCSFCQVQLCTSCGGDCEICSQFFCRSCFTIDYSQPQSRTFCLDCCPQKINN